MKILLIGLVLIPIISIIAVSVIFNLMKSSFTSKAEIWDDKKNYAEENRIYYNNLKMNKYGFYSGTNSPVHGHSGGRTIDE